MRIALTMINSVGLSGLMSGAVRNSRHAEALFCVGSCLIQAGDLKRNTYMQLCFVLLLSLNLLALKLLIMSRTSCHPKQLKGLCPVPCETDHV